MIPIQCVPSGANRNVAAGNLALAIGVALYPQYAHDVVVVMEFRALGPIAIAMAAARR